MESREVRKKISQLFQELIQKPHISSKDLRQTSYDLMDLSAEQQRDELISECSNIVDAIFFDNVSNMNRNRSTLTRKM